MPMLIRTCFYCKTDFEASHALANICSPDCRAKTYPPGVKTQLPRPRPASAARAKPAAVVRSRCPRCGRSIPSKKAPRRYCSSACRNATRRKVRQDRIRLVYVEPVVLAVLRQRDNDTCRICGEPIDPTARPPSPHSATIDHVLPLARGGEHSYNNTQLAHYRCNTAKGSG